MSYFPELGDSVKITRGRHYGKIAVVKSIEPSHEQPLYVVDIGPDLLFADWLSPYDVEPYNVEPVVSETRPELVSATGSTRSTIPSRKIMGRKIASAKTIDKFPVSAWRQAVAESLTYRGYTSWIGAIENGEDWI